jgi:predicted dehydrogenase
MIKFGIVGAGRIARKFATDIQFVANAKIVAIASQDAQRAKRFSEEFHIKNKFNCYSDMAEFKDVDAVYIATPHNFHKEQSILFLTHKKHVLCEKPIAVNYIEFEEMEKIAKLNNVLLMEAMWTRFLPAIRRLKEIVESNIYGRLLEANISFGFDLASQINESDRVLNPHLAGGSLLDLGVYCANLVDYISNDDILDLKAQCVMSKTNVDLSTDVTMMLANKQKTKIKWRSSINETLNNKAVLQFESGKIIIPNFWSATELDNNGVNETYFHKSGGFEYEIEAFASTILEGKFENQSMSLNDSKTVMKLLDKIREKIGLEYPFE